MVVRQGKRLPGEAGGSPFIEIFRLPPDKAGKLLLVQGTSGERKKLLNRTTLSNR